MMQLSSQYVVPVPLNTITSNVKIRNPPAVLGLQSGYSDEAFPDFCPFQQANFAISESLPRTL
jgi:hypothetical protein